ncbi:hypothetical protein ACFYWP_19880 [Actinacidiphila glaucinigra]|uniref:hypothetical protein n=1 Tax=Actinacidiphila glaucinigra TaxID=235986 RepID=UPI0036A44906
MILRLVYPSGLGMKLPGADGEVSVKTASDGHRLTPMSGAARPARTGCRRAGVNMGATKRSGMQTAIRVEAVVILLLMSSWGVLSLAYDDEVGAELLDGPWLPFGCGIAAVSSLAFTWWLQGRGSAGLRAVGSAITIMRLAVVLLLCLLVAYELLDLTGGLGSPGISDTPPRPAG